MYPAKWLRLTLKTCSTLNNMDAQTSDAQLKAAVERLLTKYLQHPALIYASPDEQSRIKAAMLSGINATCVFLAASDGSGVRPMDIARVVDQVRKELGMQLNTDPTPYTKPDEH